MTIAFEARIVGGRPRPTPEATEIVAFAPEDIPWADIAFRTTQWALRDLARWPAARPRAGHRVIGGY